MFPHFRRALLLTRRSTLSTTTAAAASFPSSSFNQIPTAHHNLTSTSHFLSLSFKPFSSSSSTLDEAQLAHSIATHLLQQSTADVTQTLQSTFPFVTLTPTPSLLLAVLNLSSDAGRSVLTFHQWLLDHPTFRHTDETLSLFVHHFGRRHDFKAAHDVILASRDASGPVTFAAAVDRLVRAGRAGQAVAMFEKMEEDYGMKRDKDALRMVVEKLCEHGFASNAEKMVKGLVKEFFPDEGMCDLLIKGWCVDGKLDEARRLAGEMYRGGFEIGTSAFNAILDCVCRLCRKKDPFRLHSKAEQILVDMEYHGVPRNVETFNVLITNLCKIRKTNDALNLFHRMGEWGCSPDETTYLELIRSLYQAARIGEGDEMIDRMKSAGFGEALDKKAYFGFLKILCGIERIDHALSVFKMMKKDGCEPGIKTYDLLMGKLYAHNRADRATALFNEAQKNGVAVTQKAYPVDPKYLKNPKAKKENTRETLPEKMARKRRSLKQIRLSFVKKPKKGMCRAY